MDVIFFIFIFLTYILGSINFAEIFTSRKLGIDIRSLGDGNPGATNVFYNVDRKLGLIVLILDILKGFIPIFIAYNYEITGNSLALIGLFSIIGHQYPVFHKFKGGTGIATTIGVMMFLTPKITFYTIIFSLIIIAVINHYKRRIRVKLPPLEIGEAVGFILLLSYSFFSAMIIKIFMIFDLILIMLKRTSRVREFLHESLYFLK